VRKAVQRKFNNRSKILTKDGKKVVFVPFA
jgi:hypothetical protein